MAKVSRGNGRKMLRIVQQAPVCCRGRIYSRRMPSEERVFVPTAIKLNNLAVCINLQMKACSNLEQHLNCEW